MEGTMRKDGGRITPCWDDVWVFSLVSSMPCFPQRDFCQSLYKKCLDQEFWWSLAHQPCCLGKMSTGILINYYTMQQLSHMCGLAIFPHLDQGLVHQVASYTRKVLSSMRRCVPSTEYCWMGQLCTSLHGRCRYSQRHLQGKWLVPGHPADQWQSWECSRNIPEPQA